MHCFPICSRGRLSNPCSAAISHRLQDIVWQRRAILKYLNSLGTYVSLTFSGIQIFKTTWAFHGVWRSSKSTLKMLLNLSPITAIAEKHHSFPLVQLNRKPLSTVPLTPSTNTQSSLDILPISSQPPVVYLLSICHGLEVWSKSYSGCYDVYLNQLSWKASMRPQGKEEKKKN